MTHLNEFDKIEWRDVCRCLKPELTDAAFEELWAEFVRLKQQKQKS